MDTSIDTSDLKEYIGTKKIKAKLCTLQEAEEILGYPAGQPSEDWCVVIGGPKPE
jgi:prolyl-tRNA editing enzyme YbaK/EbsC (Cys-tRNA(Pro) deacylase)